MSRPVRPFIRTLAVASGIGALLFASGTAPALAAPNWMDLNTVYDSWTQAQYDTCETVGSETIEILSSDDTLQVGDELSSELVSPARCYAFTPMSIVNQTASVVRVEYFGGSDTGTVADYLFEWADGWSDVVLIPGAASETFSLYLGMPADVPNAAQGTSGTFQWDWRITEVEPPIALMDDNALTDDRMPVTIDVLANDTAPAGSTVSIPESANALGTWVVATDGTVTFTPNAFVAGRTVATPYTVTTPYGQTATATISVRVDAARLGLLLEDVRLTTTQDTPITHELPSGLDYQITDVGLQGASVWLAGATMTYTPADGFTGTDSYTMTGCNDALMCDEFTVFVEVTPLQTVPAPVGPEPTPPTPEDPEPAPPAPVDPEPTPPAPEDPAPEVPAPAAPAPEAPAPTVPAPAAPAPTATAPAASASAPATTAPAPAPAATAADPLAATGANPLKGAGIAALSVTLGSLAIFGSRRFARGRAA